jgi:hypothetical protein
MGIVPRTLGVVNYGNFNYCTNILTKFLNLLDFRASTFFYTKISQNNFDINLKSFFTKFILIIFSVSIIIVGIFLGTNLSNYFFPYLSIFQISSNILISIENFIYSNFKFNYFRTYDVEIGFCHKAFKWQNNAKNKAVVAVIIVSLRRKTNTQKVIYQDGHIKTVSKISPYLTDNSNLIIEKRSSPFSNLPHLVYGNQAIDNGLLELSDNEKNELLKVNPSAQKFIKRLYGGADFINGINRWCIWVKGEDREEAEKIPFFQKRFQQVYEFRKNGGDVARSLVDIPYRFRYVHEPINSLIILPKVTSEKRQYLPVDFADSKAIALQTLQVIYDSDPFVFGLLSSKIHITWVKAVAGGMKTDIVYSNSLCYNSFPFPIISNQRKEELTQCTFRILEEREKHPEKTLAQLYDPNKMPEGLKEAHRLNDEAVERCYRSTSFNSDEERLEYLFKLYEKMIQEEKEKGTLFEAEKKTRKKK